MAPRVRPFAAASILPSAGAPSSYAHAASMVRYSLAPGFELLSGDTLVASDSSRSTTLAADELPVVALLLTGSQTLDDLEQGLSVGHRPLTAERIREVLHRLEALRVIASSDEASVDGAEALTDPAVPNQDLTDVHRVTFAPTDRLRAFRGDLTLTRKAGGLFEVLDPASGKSTTLYDFEVSLARMLDGTRTFQDVLEAGGRLGIPLKAEGLNSFLRQLERSGFLSDPAAAPPPAAARAPREEWDAQTRELFVTGVRLLGQGKAREAAGYFEAILEVHPDHAEARDLIELAGASTELPSAPRPGSRVWLPVGLSLVAALIAAIAVSAWYSSKLSAIEQALQARTVDARPAAALDAGAVAAATPPTLAVPAGPPVAPSPAPAPPDAGPAWVDDGRPFALTGAHFAIVQTLRAEAEGRLHWTRGSGAAVTAGLTVGVILPRGGAAPEAERPLVVTAAGQLGKIQPEHAAVTDAQVVAIVTDSKRWELTVTGASPDLEQHVACRLARSDGTGQPVPCEYRRDGERLFIQVAGTAARWLRPGGAGRLVR